MKFNHSSEIAAVLYTGAGLVALWFVLGRYRAAATDKFRQDLFALRAELFDYARDGGVVSTADRMPVSGIC